MPLTLTLPLTDVSTTTPAQAPMGSVIGVLNDRELALGWVIGRNGQATHAVMSDEVGIPRAWPLAQLGAAHVLVAAPLAALALSVQSNEANPHAIRSFVGCLGLTARGMVVCVGGLVDAWRHLVPWYINARTGELLDEMNPDAARAVWLTNWDLSVRGFDDQLTRVIGNPAWPTMVREQR